MKNNKTHTLIIRQNMVKRSPQLPLKTWTHWWMTPFFRITSTSFSQ